MQGKGSFGEESERELVAAAVRDLIYVSAAWDVVRLLTIVPFSPTPRLGFTLTVVKALLVEGIPFLLLRRGDVYKAAWILSMGALLLASLFVILSGGILSPAVAVVVGLLAAITILFERRTAILLALCILAFLSGLAILQWQGTRLPHLLTESVWVTYTTFLSAGSLALIPGLRTLDRLAAKRRLLEDTQLALRKSETLFRGISEASPAGVFRTDAKGGVVYVNPKLLEIWGTTWEHFQGMGFLQRVHLEDREKLTKAILVSRANRQCLFMEYRLSNPNGSIQWLAAQSSPVMTPGREFDGMVGTVIDITERKRAEELLTLKEAHMHAILDSEPECVKTLTEDCSLIDMNLAGLKMIEAESIQQVTGACVLDLVAPDFQNEFAALIRKVFAGASGKLEFKLTGLKGTTRWLETHAVPLRNADGTIIAALGITRDISDRKARQDNQRRLELIQAAVPIGVWDWDPRGQEAWANAEGLRMFGFPGGGDRIADEFRNRIHPEDWPMVERKLNASLAGAGRFEAEYRVVWPDSSVHWIEDKAEAILGADGTAIRIVGISQDITVRKQREQELRESEENFRALFERAHYGVLLLDVTDLSIIAFNEVAHTQLGYTRDEFAKLRLWDFQVEMTEEQVRREGRQSSLNGSGFETRHRTKSGAFREVLVNATIITMSGQSRVYAVNQDITERKRAERQLLVSEAQQRILARLSGAFWEQKSNPIAALSNTVQMLESGFADVCTVRLLSPDGKFLDPPAVAFGSTAEVREVCAVLDASLPVDESFLHQEVLRSGKGKLLALFDSSTSALTPEHRKVNRKLGTHSVITVPLRADGRSIGVLMVARYRSGTPSFNDQDLGFLQELADRAAIALVAAKVGLELQAELAQRNAMEVERESMLAQMQQLTKHLEIAREEERRRIAREIHDELGQQLTGLKMRFDFLFRAPLTPTQLAEQKQSFHHELETAIRTVRTIATVLRPGVLDSLGLAAALEWLAQDFEDRFGIPCVTGVKSFPADDAVATTVFRVAQEALTNVAKHSHATKVWLNCFGHSGSIWLDIFDNGTGIRDAKSNQNGGFGLIGMRERAALAGGSLIVSEGQDGGTRLLLTLPMDSMKEGKL